MNRNIIAHMIDCATPLTAADCAALKAEGIQVVGRYLGAKSRGYAKGLTPEEEQAIHAEGIHIVAIFEGDPVAVSDFTREQGIADAKAAVEDAKWLGQPAFTAIYLTVDYPAAPADMPIIQDYVSAAEAVLHNAGYQIGIYGGARVIDSIRALYYFQTCAWSGSEVSARADIYQHPSQTLGNLQVDKDDVFAQPGWWAAEAARSAPVTTPLPADVPADLWCASGVRFALDHKIMGVFEGGDFKPNDPLTRGQAAVLAENLARLKL